MEIKPETLRFVVCANRDLVEDAAFDFEAWLWRKIGDGMRATINYALLPPDLKLQPLQDPALWFDRIGIELLVGLCQRESHIRDRLSPILHSAVMAARGH
jgi:hypothetical protein